MSPSITRLLDYPITRLPDYPITRWTSEHEHSFWRLQIHRVEPPVTIVFVREIGPEMPTATLFAAQRGPHDEPCDGQQVEMAPRVAVRRRRPQTDPFRGIRLVETGARIPQPVACTKQTCRPPHQISQGLRADRTVVRLEGGRSEE